MSIEIKMYHEKLNGNDRVICEKLYNLIESGLDNSKAKIWHGAPVWFIDENPVCGYSPSTNGVQLLFWSGQSFNEPIVFLPIGKHQASAIYYANQDEIIENEVIRLLNKSKTIQWDYKNMVKRKGILLPLFKV